MLVGHEQGGVLQQSVFACCRFRYHRTQTHTESATAARIPVSEPVACTAEDKDKDRNDARDRRRAAKPEEKDKEVVLLENRLAASERGIKTSSRAAAVAEAAFEEKKKELRDWTEENFDNASPDQV